MTGPEEGIPDGVPDGVAIVGMDVRLPGARSAAQFWDNLVAGRESIADLTEDELRAEGVPDAVVADPHYVRRAPLLDGIEEFDAEFFGFTPVMARGSDPQLRLFLQSAWHAFEDAGYDPARTGGSAGVFGTCSTSGYLLFNLLSHRDMREMLGVGATGELIALMAGSDDNFLATRTAFQLDLRGPALTVQTACSSALVAVHLACQSLLAGECDLALAGGVSVKVPHRVGYLHDPGSMQSVDGHCRAFDATSTGTLFGSGVGTFLLKPLAAALADGDTVRAVIRGSAINNDGSLKMGFPAPSVDGQAEAIAEALAVADVDPSSVGYVEAHGTGTQLGDPVELAALTKAFGARRSGPRTAIGSVKSNLGHLDVAAGVPGLAKTVLMLEHRALPPTLHVTSPNPELRLDASPFAIQTEYAEWTAPDGVPRRAGVSALGVGGTNAHLVLEEAPAAAARPASARPQVLLLSARDGDALRDAGAELAAALTAPGAPDLADAAHTLAAGRRPFRHRRAVVAGSAADAAEVLDADGDPRSVLGRPAGDETEVAFLFPGQGAQYPGMTADLYAADAGYRDQLDEVAGLFSERLGVDVAKAVLSPGADLLEHTDVAQAALFTVEYALARTLQRYGVVPGAYAGHSIGEYPAAALAGVFDLPDAVAAVAARGRLMASAAPGAMLAVRLPEAEVAGLLGQAADTGLELAAVNEPAGCVVAGPADAVERLADSLNRRSDGLARRVATPHAFHTAAMGPAADAFAAELAGMTLHAPRVPLLSNATGTWLTAAEATDRARWAGQIRSAVRFGANVDELLDEPRRVLVEVGPGRSLGTFARRSRRWGDGHRIVRTTRHPDERRDDTEVFLLGLGALWANGVDVDWSPAHEGRPPRRVPLPTYPFRRHRYWTPSRYAGATPAPASPSVEPASVELAAPSTGSDAETVIARVWSQLLGVEGIGQHSNFFELGGDSMVAVQVAAAAGRAGLRIVPQDLFEHQTVAALAAAALRNAPASGPAPDPSVVPIPPTLWRYLDPADPRESSAVPLVLEVAPEVGPDVAAAALTAVVDLHDALRLRVESRDGLFELRIGDKGEPVDLPTVGAVSELVGQLRYDGTPLLRAGWLPAGGGRPPALVLVLHDIVADAASREIVAADVATACEALRAGRQVELPPPTTPWRAWAQRVNDVAADPGVRAERALWLAPERSDPALRLDLPAAAGAAAPALAGTALAEDETGALLALAQVGGLRVEEFLLGALATAAREVLGRDRLLVDVEGDGRAVPFDGVELSRTVGSCTTVYPVVAAAADVPGAALRAVPRHGLGHDVLRYLYAPTAAALAALPQAEVLLTERVGAPTRLAHAVELRAYERGGRLVLDWWFDARRVEPAVVEALAAAATSALRVLLGGGSGDAAELAGELGLSGEELRQLFDVAVADQRELLSATTQNGDNRTDVASAAPPTEETRPVTTTTDARAWYRTFEDRSQAPVRVYCFPFAGGAASVYRPWTSVLPRSIELRAVQLPGRQDRMAEPPFTEIGAVVTALADVLSPELGEVPYAFFGHSMGALIAFELTRELRRRGAPLPALLGLSGWPPGERASKLPAADLTDEQLIAAVKRYGGMPGAVLAAPDLLAFVLPVLRADFAVAGSYRHVEDEPLPVPLAVFGGQDDAFVPSDGMDGWDRRTSRGATVRILPGRHFFLVRQVREVVTAFVGDLRRELGESS